MENKLKISQEVRYERLLIASGIKICDHKHTYEDYCLVCKEVALKKGA